MKKKLLITTIISALLISATFGVSALTGDQPAKNATQTSNESTPVDTTQTPSTNETAPVTTVPVTTQKSKTTTPTVVTPTAPVVVSTYAVIPVSEQGDNDCRYTYSDGTTKQFHWQTIDPHAAWVQGPGTPEGHYAAGIITSGVCDDSIVGTVKD